MSVELMAVLGVGATMVGAVLTAGGLILSALAEFRRELAEFRQEHVGFRQQLADIGKETPSAPLGASPFPPSPSVSPPGLGHAAAKP